MQNAQLQAMTVVQLRKLAKENGVKLSAGIDKSGIVARLSEALPDEPDVQTAAPEQPEMPQVAAPAPQSALEAEKEEETPAETAAGGAPFGGRDRGVPWRFGFSRLEQPPGTGRLPAGLSPGMAGAQHVA